MGIGKYDDQQCCCVDAVIRCTRTGNRARRAFSSAGLEKKISAIKDAIANYQPDKEDPVDVPSKSREA